MYTFHSSSLHCVPTCTEEVALIDFRSGVLSLELGSSSFPMQVVQEASLTKGLRCIYFLFGLYNHPKTTLSYIGRTENLRDRLYQYPHKEAKTIGYAVIDEQLELLLKARQSLSAARLLLENGYPDYNSTFQFLIRSANNEIITFA